MGVKNKTCFLGLRKFPTHRLLLLSFPLLKIQQQEKRKITQWRQRRSWEHVDQQVTRINGIYGFITVFVLNSLFPSNNKFKFVFSEKPPLLNITLSPVKLSNLWLYLARTNFAYTLLKCWVVLLLTSVIYAVLFWYPEQVHCSTRVWRAMLVNMYLNMYACNFSCRCRDKKNLLY